MAGKVSIDTNIVVKTLALVIMSVLISVIGDVWSLGVVLFELAALELPFQAQNLAALVHRICMTEPPYAKLEESYSPAMIDLVRSPTQNTLHPFHHILWVT
jgi:serine/threonine protein kinase